MPGTKNQKDAKGLTMESLMTFVEQTEKDRMNGLIEGKLLFADDESKKVSWEFPIQEWELNSHSGLHGGVLASMMDFGMGFWAQHFCGEGTVTTASLSINYQKPFPKNDSVLLTAKIVSKGRRLITATSEAYIKSTGKLAATAMGTYARIPRPRG